MKLYFTPRTRATRPRWLLEELEAEYELVLMPRNRAERRTDAYLQVHPHGRVPALEDGSLKIFESAALCLYLADKYPEKELAPAFGTPERGTYYQWIVYAVATLEPPVMKYYYNTRMLPEEQRSAQAVEDARQEIGEIGPVLSRVLEKGPYLLGEHFTAADVMIGSIVPWMGFLGLLEEFPVLRAYAERVSSRPAYQRANQAPTG